MTLHTKLAICGPADADEVWSFMRVVLGVNDAAYRWRTGPGGYQGEIGQGRAAWMDLRVDPDGEWLEPQNQDHPDEDEREPWFPRASMIAGWDTGYGYRDKETGDGCTSLHARQVAALGAWCDARGIEWWWFDEYGCHWNKGATGFDKFGVSGVKASEWFTEKVLPIINEKATP